ncbi:hypothetical protein DFH11DRAFT_1744574 [Phellopilus nigrolimitatus]|nr:hypothetical protein DFH11DRAFT_1744574 [Phellopilus nigrolimitatus]
MSGIPRGPVATALAIAEIQLQIFSLIEKSDSARCARVCRRWKEAALDRVWSSMDSLVPLVQLLAPLKMWSRRRKPDCHNPGALKFSRTIRAEDWEKFMPYARRVKHLEISLPEFAPVILDSSVFLELARSRRMLSILPNLSVLKIGSLELDESLDVHKGWSKHVLLFLHNRIRSLEIHIEDVDEGDKSLDVLFDDITEWAPLISELTIEIGSGKEGVNSSVSNLISRLAFLKTLRISPYSLSQSVINSLASLQNLRTVQLIPDIMKYHEYKYQRLNTDSAFPLLKSIPLCGELGSICLLLKSPNAFQNLLELNISNEGKYELVHLHSLFDLIPHASPFLRKLTISCDPRKGPVIGSIHAEILRPLTSNSHLEILELDFARAIDLTASQMVDIFGKCGYLTTLTLNTGLSRFSDTTLTLDVLQWLSEACPQLVNLGLYVDARIIPSTPDLFHVHGFRNLRVLHFGTSPIHDPGCASLYLSRIIPSQCTLVVHPSYVITEKGVNVFVEHWKEVKKILPSCIQSYKDSQEAIQVLRQERDAWRSRALGAEASAIRHRDKLLL